MKVDDRPRPHEAAEPGEPPAAGLVARARTSRRGADIACAADVARAADIACALLLFIAALLWFGLSLDRTLHLTDEGYLLRLGQRVAQGEIPHRDFVEDYGPGVIAALGALVSAGDGEIFFVRRALAVWKALAVVLGFMCARLLVPRGAAIGVGVLSIVYWGRASLNVNAPHAAVLTIPICMAAAWLLAVASKQGHGTNARRHARLLFAAGVLCAVAVLFKQSLGVMNAYGLSLAIAGASLAGLDPAERTTPAGERPAWPWLIAWGVAGLALLVPGAAYLGVREYLTHIAPIHVAMAFVAVALWRRGSGPELAGFMRTRVAPFALGGLLPLAMVALYYASNGHLDDLLTGMFERPFRRRNYATPTMTPPLGISLFVLGALASVLGAALVAAGRSRRSAIASGGVGIACMAVAVLVVPHANPDLYTPAVLVRSARIFDWVLHSSILLAAACLFGPKLLRVAVDGHEPDGANAQERARLRALLPIFFFSGLLYVQVFPRGAHNVWMAHAAWMPLLGVVLYEIWRRFAAKTPAPRRLALAALVLLVPAWLAWPVADRTWRRGHAPTRSLELPRTTGMQVRLGAIRRWHLEDVEALVAHLGAQPQSPLLLVGGDVMLHHLSGRPPLRPEHEYALYNTVLDMLPLRELAALEDGRWVEALEREPGTQVVLQRDESASRIRSALPSLDAHLNERGRVVERFGVYEVWVPESEGAAGPEWGSPREGVGVPERRTPR